jgi:hypothetical protein
MKTKKECEKLIKKLSQQLVALQHIHPIHRLSNLKEETIIKAKINMLLWVCDIGTDDQRYEDVNNG